MTTSIDERGLAGATPSSSELQRERVSQDLVHLVFTRCLDRITEESERALTIAGRSAEREDAGELGARARDQHGHSPLDHERRFEMSNGIVEA